jgi:hypothetical protein
MSGIEKGHDRLPRSLWPTRVDPGVVVEQVALQESGLVRP